MATRWNQPQLRLLTLVVLSAVIAIGDIIALNLIGEVSEFWWFVAVPIGLLLVGAMGIVALVALLINRGAPRFR